MAVVTPQIGKALPTTTTKAKRVSRQRGSRVVIRYQCGGIRHSIPLTFSRWKAQSILAYTRSLSSFSLFFSLLRLCKPLMKIAYTSNSHSRTRTLYNLHSLAYTHHLQSTLTRVHAPLQSTLTRVHAPFTIYTHSCQRVKKLRALAETT